MYLGLQLTRHIEMGSSIYLHANRRPDTSHYSGGIPRVSSDARLHRLLLHGCNALWHTQQTELSRQHWLCRLPNTFTSLLLLVIHVLSYLIAILQTLRLYRSASPGDMSTVNAAVV